MKNTVLEISENRQIAKNVFLMKLAGDAGTLRPGQFVNISLEGHFLRRPISVCDCEDGVLTIVYKAVGKGTEEMSRMEKGVKLDVLTELGNGYDLSKAGDSPLLIGGGAGVPPMYYLAKKLIAEGKKPAVILGFNTKEEVFFEDEFRILGCSVSVTTADGSHGIKGFVTDAMKDGYSFFYTCGPEPMLKAVFGRSSSSGQFSFEERMGCGFGACMGCSCRTVTGYKRICKDGPVLDKEEILWED